MEERIVRHVPDVGGEPEAWTDARVLLVGSGHSAQTAARDLAELARSIDDDDGGSGRDAPRVLWAVRAEEPGWGAVDDDPLPERARLVERARKLASGSSPAVHLRTGVRVQALEAVPTGIRVTLGGNDSREEVEVDRIVALTGYVGDHRLYRQLQVHECWATSGPMKLAAALLGSSSEDCLDETSHGADVLVNPEPGFFLVGSKSYGRNNTFLLRVGWRQVDEVFGLVRTAAAS